MFDVQFVPFKTCLRIGRGGIKIDILLRSVFTQQKSVDHQTKMYIINSENLVSEFNESDVNIGELTLQSEDEIVFSQVEQGILFVLIVLMILSRGAFSLITTIKSKRRNTPCENVSNEVYIINVCNNLSYFYQIVKLYHLLFQQSSLLHPSEGSTIYDDYDHRHDDLNKSLSQPIEEESVSMNTTTP